MTTLTLPVEFNDYDEYRAALDFHEAAQDTLALEAERYEDGIDLGDMRYA